MRITLMLVVAIGIAVGSLADTEYANGYTWTYRINGDTAEIGSSSWAACAISPKPSGAVTIPSTLGGKIVTSIGSCAFYDCKNLSGVTIPAQVTKIGSSAFYRCKALKGVTIPDGVSSIGGSAFYFCTALTEMTIPNGVTSIERSTFNDCSGLKSIKLPEKLESIGDSAFYRCTGLTTIAIPNRVRSIGNNAFSGCTGLTGLTIPDGVISIDVYAFSGCASLRNITIPASVTSVGENAFSDCNAVKTATVPGWQCGIPFHYVTELTISPGTTSIRDSAFKGCINLLRVNIPASVTSVGNGAFSGSTNIVDVMVPGWDCNMPLGNVTNVVISAGARNIKDSAFRSCRGINSITIPNSVTSIGDYAFYGCSGLRSVPFPTTVNYIGSNAFSYCTKLTSIAIPNGLSSIKASTFYGCTSLTSVSIPASVTSIGAKAFSSCGLTKVNISDMGAWCSINFASSDALSLYQANLYLNGSLVTNLVIPDGVSRIRAYAFYGDSRIKSVTIPSTVTSIESSAFLNCSGLTSVHISDVAAWCGIRFASSDVNPLNYAHNLYINGSLVTDLVIPDGVTNIHKYAFFSCNSLASVTIPNSISCIEDGAFEGCRGLKGVHISDIASWCSICFKSWYANPLSYAHKLYLNGSLVTDLIIPKGVTEVGDYTFYGCSDLASVNMPIGVTRLGYCVFKGCGELKNVTLPDSIIEIGMMAFDKCVGITSVTIPQYACSSKLSSIFESSYQSLKSVIIVDGVKRINTNLFTGCASLKKVSAPVEIAEELAEALIDKIDDVEFVWTGISDVGDVEWKLDSETVHTGLVSWQSGRISNNQVSHFELNVGAAGRLSFWWKASSEFEGNDIYDYAYLSIDGFARGTRIVNGDMYRLDGVAIGGNTDWTNVVIDVSGSSPHTIRWSYCKDDIDEANVGNDCVWLDDVVWTPLVSVSFDIVGATGVVPGSTMELVGSNLLLPGAYGFAWDGYEFVGWNDGIKTYAAGDRYEIPDGDVIFTAQWVRKSVLSFSLEGGAGTAPAEIKEVPGTRLSLPMAIGFDRENYMFVGWSDGLEVYEPGAQYEITDHDVAFSAVWLANTLSAPDISSTDVTNGGTAEAEFATITITADKDSEVHYTTDGSAPTALSPLYIKPFMADGMSVTIKAIAVRENYFDSAITTFSFTRKPYSLAECIGVDDVEVSTGGYSNWSRILGWEAQDGIAALKSGAIGNSQTNWVQITVSGAGQLSFWWKVSCEGTNRGKRRDGCTFLVDNVEVRYTDGTTNGWSQVTTEVFGVGEHTFKWAYGKNGNGTSEGEDCAWLDEVVWTSYIDPIPAVAVDADTATVNAAVDGAGFVDAAVKVAIGGSATEYNAFKKWADGVKGATGDALAGEAAVVANAHAAAAYLLGAERLFVNDPTVEIGELAIVDGESAGTTTMTVAVTVKDGESAVAVSVANVAAMFEATSDLGDWDGAAKLTPTVTTSGTDASGKMTFVVTPGDGTAAKAFLRIKR